MSADIKEVIFTRSAVSRMLFCTPLTIRNREKSSVYPEPKRGENNYRIYSLEDVFTLMEITYGQVFLRPIVVEYWDQGFTQPEVVWNHLVKTKEAFYQKHTEYSKSKQEDKSSTDESRDSGTASTT